MKIVLFLLLALPLFGKQSERYYQEKFAREIGGQVEVVMKDGTRCDILTAHPQKVTVAQVIGDQSIFPSIESGERSPVPFHEAPSTSSHIIEKVKGLKPKQSISSHRKTSYMRENKDEPANKQTTNYNASGTSNLHYEQDRVKSLRERFALSGLPAHLCDFLDRGHGQSFKQRYGYPRQFFSDITGEMLAPKLLLALLETMPIDDLKAMPHSKSMV